MGCGQKRNDTRAKGKASSNAQKLRYSGYATVNVQGPVTGQVYQFPPRDSVRQVDSRDAVSILKTRLFRQAQ
jgi:hypothetical protein